MPDTARIVSCPNCKTAVKWTAKNRYRPFCSERCSLLDLGAWADGSNHIAGDPEYQNVEEWDQD